MKYDEVYSNKPDLQVWLLV